MRSTKKSGILALENGSVFKGFSFGAEKTIVGEAVFNTSMSGYQEILTDPSYSGQIVTMTAPQIGNTGINTEDNESQGPKLSGFIIKELSPITSNWRSTEPLHDYLKRHEIPGLQGIDTRLVTKNLREHGSLRACISTEGLSDAEAVRRAKEWPGLEATDYVAQVTCPAPQKFAPHPNDCKPFTVPGTTLLPESTNRAPFKIAAFDFGAKWSIFKQLAYHGFEVHVVPANTPAEAIEEMNIDGIFLSNGPGDPSTLSYVHQTVAKLIERHPTFGICLGHQMITHALGAKTFKMKFGHHGGNQPVKNLETGRVSITAQNHGYASTEEELNQRGAIVTEINLNDGTVEGLRHKDLPVFSVQYHPEAAPGPNDADVLFKDFYELIEKVKGPKLAKEVCSST